MPAILEAVPIRRGDAQPILTKRFTPNGSIPFDKVYHYRILPFDFESFDHMAETLAGLEQCPSLCIVRGEAVRDTSEPQRRLLRDQSNGDAATIKPADRPLKWVMIDIDKLPAPPGLVTERDRLDYIVTTLPFAFRHADYYYQWSSSAGRNGWDYLSVHLWFWLAEPQFCDNLHLRSSKRGGDWHGIVDPAVFTPNQVHYTAAPIFEGVPDPLERRSGIVRQQDRVALVARYVPPLEPRRVMSTRQREAARPGARAAEMLSDIGAPHYHVPLLSYIAHYVVTTPRDLQDRDGVFIQLIEHCGGRRDYITREYLERLWDTALTKFS